MLAMLGGCAGYRAGNASLYPPDIHTVYVPIFESDSFRRELGERLTEAVDKEIELKTPYKVVHTPDADSVLAGHILGDTKRVVVQDQNDQPRETEVNFVVQVSWLDRKGSLVTGRRNVPIPAAVVELSQTGRLIPEYGQSGATAEQESIQGLARQIVALMESPW
jgi:hypothetical protein